MLGQAGIGKSAGQAKIGDPDTPLRVDQKIGRFDVAMNDTVMVCVRQGFCGLKPDLGDPAEKAEPRGGSSGGRASSSSC